MRRLNDKGTSQMPPLTHPICLLLFGAACCIATSAELSAEDTEAVASRVQSYVAAFNRRDVNACVEHWSKDAEYVLFDPSTRVQGRKAIREALQKLLSTDEKFELSVCHHRFRQVSKEVILEEGTATVVSARHGIERADYVAGGNLPSVGILPAIEPPKLPGVVRPGQPVNRSSALVHYQDGTRENWLLVKMPDPQGKQDK